MTASDQAGTPRECVIAGRVRRADWSSSLGDPVMANSGYAPIAPELADWYCDDVPWLLDELERVRVRCDQRERALEWIATGTHADFEATTDAELGLGMQHVAGAFLGKHPLAARFAARAALAETETPAT